MNTLAIAHELLPVHGFADWTVQMDRWRGPQPPAYAARVFFAPRVFEFSRWLDTAPEDWLRREIVLHECAHALLGYEAHDIGWRTAAKRLGCVLATHWPQDGANWA